MVGFACSPESSQRKSQEEEPWWRDIVGYDKENANNIILFRGWTQTASLDRRLAKPRHRFSFVISHTGALTHSIPYIYNKYSMIYNMICFMFV